MSVAGHVVRKGEKRNVYSLLVEKPKRQSPLETQKHLWINNTNADLVEIVLCGFGWIGLAQDR
jgi:hypothetical protein